MTVQAPISEKLSLDSPHKRVMQSSELPLLLDAFVISRATIAGEECLWQEN